MDKLPTPNAAGLDSSLATVMGGLISDAQKLIRQEAALLRADFHESIKASNAKHGWAQLGIGSGVLLIGIFWLTVGGVYWIRDTYAFSEWASAGAVGLALAVIGIVVVNTAGKNN